MTDLHAPAPPPTDHGREPSGSGATPSPRRRGSPSPARRRPTRRAVLIALGAIIVLVIGGLMAFRALRPHMYSGTVLQAPTAAPSMEGLRYATGEPVDLGALRGDVVLVYFGYTNCPDVCPATLYDVHRALETMGGDAERVHVLMVSVDPDRDTPELLRDYVRSFDPDFRAATGSLDDLQRVTATYGVFFAQNLDEVDEDGGYTVDHTASLMGIAPDGHLRLVWPYGVDVDALAADIGELL